MENRIKQMYNEAAMAFKEYLKTHDIAKFTDNAADLCAKFNHDTDICNLMIWWSARVQGLHDQYMRSNNEKRR